MSTKTENTSQSLFVWTFLSETLVISAEIAAEKVSILICVDIPFGGGGEKSNEQLMNSLNPYLCGHSFRRVLKKRQSNRYFWVSILICVDIPFGDELRSFIHERSPSQSLFVWTFLSEKRTKQLLRLLKNVSILICVDIPFGEKRF